MLYAERHRSWFRYILDSFWVGAYQHFVDREEAPVIRPFSLRDTQGDEWSLDSSLRKPTLLVFTSPSCGPCKSIYPALRTLRADTPVDAVEVVLLSRGATRTNRELVQKHGLQEVTVLGSRKNVEEEIGVKATPWAVLVGPRGRVLYSGVAAESILPTLVSTASHRMMRTEAMR